MKATGILHAIVATSFIVIGLLHSYVHCQELISPSYGNAFASVDHLELMGNEADVWRLWQGFSLMMGVSFIVIGLFNLEFLRVNKFAPQSNGTIIIMIILLSTIVHAGVNYFSAMQLYGGIIGLLLECIILVSNLKSHTGVL